MDTCDDNNSLSQFVGKLLVTHPPPFLGPVCDPFGA